MVRFNGVNHLAMATGDLDKTVRFWRDLLGMRLVAGLGTKGFRHYFLQIDDRDLLAFFEWPGVEPVEPKAHGRPVTGPFVFDHVSFGCEVFDRCNIVDTGCGLLHTCRTASCKLNASPSACGRARVGNRSISVSRCRADGGARHGESGLHCTFRLRLSCSAYSQTSSTPCCSCGG